MGQVPINTGAFIFSCGLLLGFFCGLYVSRANFSSTSIPTTFTGDDTLSNFTPWAQQVIDNFLGIEHLLLGLIKLDKGVAVHVLEKIGMDLEKLRMEIEKLIGTGPDQKLLDTIPYTPRAKTVLSLALKEAKALNHTYVGTEHILLGLLREGDGVAARVLKNMNVNIEQTRQEILKELDPNIERP
jgi:ATP-dependent Clp protease ATP-binding subunit ClpC